MSIPSERAPSKLSENQKIVEIGPPELLLTINQTRQMNINLLGGPLEVSGPPLAGPSASDGVGVVSSRAGVDSFKVGGVSSPAEEEVDTVVT